MENKKITGVVNRRKYELYLKAACSTLFLRSIVKNANPGATMTKDVNKVMFKYFVNCDSVLSNNTGDNKELNKLIKAVKLSGITPEAIKHAKTKGYKLEQKFMEEGEEFVSYLGSKYNKHQQVEKMVALEVLGITDGGCSESEVRNKILYVLKQFLLWDGSNTTENNPEPETEISTDERPVYNDDYLKGLEKVLQKCMDDQSTNEGTHVGLSLRDLKKYMVYLNRKDEFESKGFNVESVLQQLKNEMLMQYKQHIEDKTRLDENKNIRLSINEIRKIVKKATLAALKA